MKIIVLAGGISTERDVSIVSGTMVCKALREKGHRAVLLDVYCGDDRIDRENLKSEEGICRLFPEAYDVDAAAAYMRSFNDRIPDMKRSGRTFFGANVLELCAAADVVLWHCTAKTGRAERCRLYWTGWGSPTQDPAPLEVLLPWIRGFPESSLPPMEYRQQQGWC